MTSHMLQSSSRVVIDPHLLLQAFLSPTGAPAKLLALAAYGRTCAAASWATLDEYNELVRTYARSGDVESSLTRLRAHAELAQDTALRRAAVLKSALPPGTPDDLLLVMAAPLRDELVHLVEESHRQGLGDLDPGAIVRLVFAFSFAYLGELSPAPQWAPGSIYERGYLIQTALTAGASTLVTDDDQLLLPGDEAYRDPDTDQTVRPYALADFVRELSVGFQFGAVDAPAVLRAAVRPMLAPDDASHR
jgi:predicted nucleic acid-binding protein